MDLIFRHKYGSRHFSEDIYHPYEIYRSLEKLLSREYVNKKHRNTYEITLRGESILSYYHRLFYRKKK